MLVHPDRAGLVGTGRPGIMLCVRRLTTLLAALVLLGCVAAPGTTDSPSPDSVSPPPSASPALSSSPAPSPEGTDVSPIDAANALLALDVVAMTMTVERVKGEAPGELLVSGEGQLDPTGRRGQLRYDLTTLFAVPDASSRPRDIWEVAWSEDRVWARSTAEGGEWTVLDRQHAADFGGLIGRLPNEAHGLIGLVAEADVTSVAPVASDRFRVSLPIEELAHRGVPADAPDAEVIRRTYGVEAVDLEVSIVQGLVRQVRYVFHRDEARYGGPDRTTVTYEYLPSDAELVVPPEGAPA